MQALLKIIAGLVAVILLALATIAIYWIGSDKSEWRDYLARLASEQLGRELTIGGALKPSISLAHGLVLNVENLHLANAPGYQPADMLAVPELTIGIDLRALFSDSIHITSLTLAGATVNLESRGQANNWTFQPRQQQPVAATGKPAVKTSDGKVLSFAADGVSGRDIVIAWRQDGAVKTYRIEKFTLDLPSAGRAQLDITADLDGTALQARIRAGTVDDLRLGRTQPLAISTSYGALDIDLDARYSRHENQHRLDALTLTSGKIRATGNLALDLSGSRPAAGGKLTLPQLDTAWLGSKNSAGEKTGGKTGEKALFSRVPLPWAALDSLDADLHLAVGALLQDGQPWGPADLQARVQAGQLNSTLILQPPGAAQPVTIKIAGNTAQQARLNVSAPALDSTLWARFLGDDPFILSPAAVTLDLAGQGASAHAIAAGANGAFSFVAQPGKLKPSALPTTVRRVLDAVFTPAVMNEAALGCLQARFAIASGVAQADGIGADSNIAGVSGEGRINLGDETVKLRLVAVPKIPSISNLRLPISIEGPLASPGFGADAVAAAGQVAGKITGAILGARLGDFAAQAIDKAGQSLVRVPPNPCASTLAMPAAADATTVPPSLPAIPPQIVEDVKKARQRTLDFLKNPLDKLRGKPAAEGSAAVPAPVPVETPAPAVETPAAPEAQPAEQPAVE